MSAPLLVSERPRPRIAKQPLNVGCLIYERMDQIDFTGPFEVPSRMSDTTIRIIGREVAPVRDVQGFGFRSMCALRKQESLMFANMSSPVVRIPRFKNLPPFRHCRGRQSHV